MKLLKNGQSGQALIMALILLALSSLLVVPILNLAGTSLNYHQVIERNTLETYAADSGVEYALCELGNNPGQYEGELLQETFIVNDKTVNVTAEYLGSNIYKITSTATTDSNSSTTIESYVEVIPGVFRSAVTATSGDLFLEDSTIDGDIYAGGSVTLEDSQVTGTITEYGTLEFPPLDIEPYKQEALSGGTINGNLVLGAGTHNLGPKYITGYLKIEDGATVTMGGTVYVEGLEKIGANLTIHIEAGANLTGTGNLIAQDGHIKIEMARFELDNIPLVAALNGDIQKGEQCEYIKAILYAPEGDITLENIVVYGVVFGNTVSLLQNVTIIYPAEGESDLIGGGEVNRLTHSIN